MQVPAVTSPVAGSASPCQLQIVLLTYQPSVLADDIFDSAARLALERPEVSVVVAWGGSAGERQDRWLDQAQELQEHGANVVVIAHPTPLQRMRLALALPSHWVLPLADDDPIAVNYLRALADGCAQAGDDVSAVLPSDQVQNGDSHTQVQRHAGWTTPDANARLQAMLTRPGQQGTLFWAAYRHQTLADWLAMALALPFQPSYLDQFLPHLAACQGRMVVATEDTILLKDERHWQDMTARTRTDARYYPRPDMTLFHEWFWVADLWRLLAGRADDIRSALALKAWARHMTDEQLDHFQTRTRILGLNPGTEHMQMLQTLRPCHEWLHSPDQPDSVVEGMQVLATIALDLRARFLQPPDALEETHDAQPQARLAEPALSA